MEWYDLPADATFLISVKALILDDDGRLLLLENILDPPKWELPGGLIDYSEAIPDALQREVMEETGLTIDVGEVFDVRDGYLSGFRFRDGRVLDTRIFLIAYTCQMTGGEIRLSDEHINYKWFTVDDLDGRRYISNLESTLRRFFDLYT